VVGTRSRAIRTRTANEDCKAKTSPDRARKKGRRDVQRRIAQERVPTTDTLGKVRVISEKEH